MCWDLIFCRKWPVLKTAIKLLRPQRRQRSALRSWTSEGVDRGEGDKWSPIRYYVKEPEVWVENRNQQREKKRK
jgi:hypothetical protein